MKHIQKYILLKNLWCCEIWIEEDFGFEKRRIVNVNGWDDKPNLLEIELWLWIFII